MSGENAGTVFHSSLTFEHRLHQIPHLPDRADHQPKYRCRPWGERQLCHGTEHQRVVRQACRQRHEERTDGLLKGTLLLDRGTA